MISLYVDFVAIFVLDSEQSILHLLQLINSFGEVSSYTIHWRKSKLMSIADDPDPHFLSSIHFKITSDCMKYLDIQIPKKPRDLFKQKSKQNTEKLNKFKRNIEKWTTLPLSLIGHVNSVKMLSLPMYFYLFQSLFSSLNVSQLYYYAITKHTEFLKATFKKQEILGAMDYVSLAERQGTPWISPQCIA